MKAARARLARAKRVESRVRGQLGADQRFGPLDFPRRQRRVHQSVGGAAHEVESDVDDVDADRDRHQRIEDPPLRHRHHDEQPGDDARRRPDVGQEVLRVGLDRDAVVLLAPTFSIMRAAPKFAAPAMERDGKPRAEVRDRLRIDEAADRGGDDRDRRDQDQRALDAAREVFGLVVTVGVALVGGTARRA